MEGAGHLRRVKSDWPQSHKGTEHTLNEVPPVGGGIFKWAHLCASVSLWPIFLTSGCSYAGARLHDLGDIVRLEGHVGYGLQAHANAGELFHLGAGSSRQWSAGWIYGRAERGTSAEEHLPLTLVYTLLNPEQDHVHRVALGPEGAQGTHRCYFLFPGMLNPGGLEKDDMRYLDLEAGVLAGVVGVDLGFSVLELLDFVLGLFRFSESWTVLDPADDDPEALRETRRLWSPRRRSDGVIPTRPN